MIQRCEGVLDGWPVLWVKDDRWSIRQGDFTSAELRQIADEQDQLEKLEKEQTKPKS